MLRFGTWQINLTAPPCGFPLDQGAGSCEAPPDSGVYIGTQPRLHGVRRCRAHAELVAERLLAEHPELTLSVGPASPLHGPDGEYLVELTQHYRDRAAFQRDRPYMQEQGYEVVRAELLGERPSCLTFVTFGLAGLFVRPQRALIVTYHCGPAGDATPPDREATSGTG